MAEKIVGLFGLLLVLGVVGYLVYQGFQRHDPPEIVLEVKDVIAQETGYLIEIKAINRGGQAAEGLVVTAQLLSRADSNGQADTEAGPMETDAITFENIPPYSQRQGGIFFRHNPLDYTILLDVGGYTTP